MDDTNPHASPRCQEPATSPEAGGEEPSAWRDGDVLVARRKGGKLVKKNNCPPITTSNIAGSGFSINHAPIGLVLQTEFLSVVPRQHPYG